jgi:hypothetical protein
MFDCYHWSSFSTERCKECVVLPVLVVSMSRDEMISDFHGGKSINPTRNQLLYEKCVHKKYSDNSTRKGIIDITEN